MRLMIDGVEVRAVTINTAPGRAVIALQRALGMGLPEIIAQASEPTEQAWANKIMEFLAEHNRGRFVTWDEILDRPIAQLVKDADELAREAEEAGAEGTPTRAGTGTPADATPAVPAPAPAHQDT